MAKLLQLNLTHTYKSFGAPFRQNFTGDLAVLSGINGSGKSQLIDIIKGHEFGYPHIGISRIITQDGAIIDHTAIAHKSFRDYSSIAELTGAHVNSLSSVRDTVVSWYSQYRLDANNPGAGGFGGFRDAATRAGAILFAKYGEKFSGGTLTQDEIKSALPRHFVLFSDDIFSNKIGEIFFNYVSLVHNKEAEAGRNGTPFDPASLPVAPWKELNDLFAKLNFGYRFKNCYQRVDDEIDEQPAIYAIKDDGSTDLTQKRRLSDLSDGEKALISLTFAVLASEQTQPKVLLLDEFDATLNPSLVTAFFTILEEFFVERGVQVIIATHSSATLSLAPDYATFYEVYKPRNERPRVLQVLREQYEELAVANRNFYDKIENQDERYKEITAENSALKEFAAQLQAVTTDQILQVVTEGRNIDHIAKALALIDSDLLARLEIVSGAEGRTGKQQLKNAFEILSKIAGTPQTLFVWDWDSAAIVETLEETTFCHKFCFARNDENTCMKNGIENLYGDEAFTEDVYIEITEQCDDGIKTTRRVDKSRFLARISTFTTAEDFENFRPLAIKIKSLLQK